MNTQHQLDFTAPESPSTVDAVRNDSAIAAPMSLDAVLSNMGSPVTFATLAPQSFWDGMKLDD